MTVTLIDPPPHKPQSKGPQFFNYFNLRKTLTVPLIDLRLRALKNSDRNTTWPQANFRSEVYRVYGTVGTYYTSILACVVTA